MNTFDEAKHPRDRGRFAPVAHREPEVSIGAGFDSRYWGLPTFRPGAWVFGDDSCAEIVAGSVVDGPLSRGVPAKECVDTFSQWQTRVAGLGTAEGDEFAAGLEDGLRVLVRADENASAADLLNAISTSPTTSTCRVNWMLALRTSATNAGYRGRLAAGVILSGAEKWWGIADDMDLAVSGPPNPAPRPAGAWASLASR